MGLVPAFAPSISLGSSLVRTPSSFYGGCTCTTRRSLVTHRPSSPKRAAVRMLGPFFPNLGDSNLLKSEIVRNEMESLEKDYFELAKLGNRYSSFDRKGKMIYVDRAVDVVDRFAIFLTRLKLSEEFSAQMFVKQYQLKLQEFGLTIESLIANTKKSLEMMKEDIPEA